MKIRLWGLLHQATFGDATVDSQTQYSAKFAKMLSIDPQRSMTDVLRDMRDEEWKKHRGTSKTEAKKKYVALVTECCPDWRLGWIKKQEDKERDQASTKKSLMWVLKLSLDKKCKIREIRIMQGCNDTQGEFWFQLEGSPSHAEGDDDSSNGSDGNNGSDGGVPESQNSDSKAIEFKDRSKVKDMSLICKYAEAG